MAKRNQYNRSFFPESLTVGLEAATPPNFNTPTLACLGSINFAKTTMTTDIDVITDAFTTNVTQNATDRGIINFTNVTLNPGERFNIALTNDRIGSVDHIFTQISGEAASGSYCNIATLAGGGAVTMTVASDTGTHANSFLTLNYIIVGRHV